VVLPLIAILILALVMDKIVMPSVTRQGSEFPLPDFTGQRYLEAQISVTELELKYEVSSEEYSLGQKMVPIPELAGKSVRQAMLDLETAGLDLGEIQWALSDTLPERVVVFSYPSAGFEVPLGSMVNLMVNRGRASSFTYAPKVVGQTLDEARRRIQEKGLKVGVISRRIDENYLPETVLEQSEPEGTELDLNTEIDLVVSSIE
jgi:serine/threonine-protein kinase